MKFFEPHPPSQEPCPTSMKGPAPRNRSAYPVTRICRASRIVIGTRSLPRSNASIPRNALKSVRDACFDPTISMTGLNIGTSIP